MKTLALDPATTTGFAIGDNATRRILSSGTWHFPPGPRRLGAFRDRLLATCEANSIQSIFYEEAGFGAAHRGRANKTALLVAFQLRGIIELVASDLGIPTHFVAPTTIKTMAGSGRATKEQMVQACKTIMGIEPRDDNEADAIMLLSFAMQNPHYSMERKVKRRRKRGEKSDPRLF
jgi:Holliday junction resolvasome RuvABC endonuclease subunit